MDIEKYNTKIASKNWKAKEYIDNKTKVEHICLFCGNTRLYTPRQLYNNQCLCYCQGGQKTIDENIQWIREECLKRDYKLLNVYRNKEIRIQYICNKHSKYIQDISLSHLKEHKGCKYCGIESRVKNTTSSKKEVMDEFKQYKKENEEIIDVFQRKSSQNKNIWWGKIKCLKHNHIFEIVKDSYKNGTGCYYCGREKIIDSITKNKEDVLKEFQQNLKDNEKIVRIFQKKRGSGWNTWYAEIECNKHGLFTIQKENHKAGKGCPVCSESKGERKIRDWLITNNIKFYKEYKFDDMKNIKNLRFDFYLPDYNMAIEYDGQQHFHPVDCFNGKKGFDQTKKRDQLKNIYCSDNNIQLIRIPYTKFDEIETILESLF